MKDYFEPQYDKALIQELKDNPQSITLERLAQAYSSRSGMHDWQNNFYVKFFGIFRSRMYQANREPREMEMAQLEAIKNYPELMKLISVAEEPRQYDDSNDDDEYSESEDLVIISNELRDLIMNVNDIGFRNGEIIYPNVQNAELLKTTANFMIDVYKILRAKGRRHWEDLCR